jgi:hypothetical protein
MKKLHSEQGISILELAIILPVMLLLIAGMIDMGFSMSRVKSVVSASRQAARVASSHSKLLSAAVACGTPVQRNCAELDPLPVSASVTDIASHAACSYLNENAPPREAWIVEVPTPVEIFEDGSSFFTTSVSVTYEGRNCFICMHQLVTTFEPRSRSSFVLEAPCS